jgi:hypothetical protein
MAANEGYELQGLSVCVCGTCMGRKEDCLGLLIVHASVHIIRLNEQGVFGFAWP